MLVQFTPIAQLPPDVAARLRSHLASLPLRMDDSPLLFEGFHLLARDVMLVQRVAKNASSSSTALFG
jgi:hypothetical protein